MKASSAMSALLSWGRPAPQAIHSQPGFMQVLAETVLPAPATPSQRPWLVMQVLADFVLIILGFTATSWLAVQHSFTVPATGLLLLYGVVFTLLGYSERLYQAETIQTFRQEIRVLAKVVCWSMFLVCVGFLWSGTNLVLIAILAASAPINFSVMLASRYLRRRKTSRVAQSTSGARNVLIVGAGPLGRTLACYLQQDFVRKRVVRGYLDDSAPIVGDIRGRVDDLARIARSEFVDEIILTVPPRSELAQKAIREARRNRIDVKIVPDLHGLDPKPVRLEKFGDIPVLTLCEERIPAFGLLLKRAIDVLLSVTGLVLASPLLAAIALAIKLDSRGPVLYRATRLGFKGRRFLCCKFRTMVTDADGLKQQLRVCNERQGAFFKMVNDPRITGVGRILRRYSLDELPQLWNVLRGEMSLVGPRPHPLDDVERYGLEDLQRLEVTPGLTGLWQVTARRDPSFERSMALDREYIGRWSLAMDFWILCKTIGIVWRGEGA